MANEPTQQNPPSPRRRGFADMTKEKRRQIASLGGRAAHARGTAHKFTEEEATHAGQLGGAAVAKDREHMARIGRRGGEQRAENLRARRAAPELRLELPGPGLPGPGLPGPGLPLLLLALLLLAVPFRAMAQPMPPVPSLRDLAWVLPRAPLGAHCTGSVVCTELGTWGVHARLTGSTLISDNRSIPGGMLTPAASFTLGGWGEAGVHFPILLGPIGTSALPLPPVVFAKGAFTPPYWIGTHGVLFASLTMPHGPFAALDANGQPMAPRYEVGAAISGPLLWMLHYGLAMSGQLSPGGLPPRLQSGIELQARFDGFNVFAQGTHSAAFCWGGSSSPTCQSSVTILAGFQIPMVAGHSSAAAGIVRGAPGLAGTTITVTLGASYDETTRAKYGDGIEAMQNLWLRLFNTVIDPFLDERCVMFDDDHTPMFDMGQKSADGKFCERDGLRTPIGYHFGRDKGSTHVCYDNGLRNCVLKRASDKDPWSIVPKGQQARRPYLKDDCHVYEEGVKLPLRPLGRRSLDGKTCEFEGHSFPIDTKFWAMPDDDTLCEGPELLACSIGLPKKPMGTLDYVGSRAEQGFIQSAERLENKIEHGATTAKDLASGKLHVQTVAGEAYDTLKEELGHVTVEDAKQKAKEVMVAGQEWWKKPTHEKLGDLAEAAGGAVVNSVENAATVGAGSLVGGATSLAGDIRKVEKGAAKVEHAAAGAANLEGKARSATARAANAEETIADHTVPPGHLPITKAPHGNRADERPATLYKKFDKNENFEKHGVTRHENPEKRYTQKEIDKGRVEGVERGPRKKMLQKERDLVEVDPGPNNREPWAGKRRPPNGNE